MMETSLGQSLLMSQGSPLILFTRPISAVFMGLAFLSIGRGIWLEMRAKTLEVAIEDPD
jgi:putative tricarboxylic transport membrane protein